MVNTSKRLEKSREKPDNVSQTETVGEKRTFDSSVRRFHHGDSPSVFDFDGQTPDQDLKECVGIFSDGIGLNRRRSGAGWDMGI